jgi:K+-transporting ATPase KdpF subunit
MMTETILLLGLAILLFGICFMIALFIVAIAVFGYMVYVLLKPEKF